MSEPLTITQLARRAAALRQRAAYLAADEERAKAQVAALRQPYEDRVQAIWKESEKDPALTVARAAYEAASKARWATMESPLGGRPTTTEGAAQELKEMLAATKAAAIVPTTKEGFRRWLLDGAPPFNLRHPNGIEARAPTAVGPFILLAAAEEYGDRFYIAVAGDPKGPTFDAQGKMVTMGPSIKGWLRVTPSEHRGDTTRASGEVDGKPFLATFGYDYSVSPAVRKVQVTEKAGSWAESVKKPLAQFKAALVGDTARRDAIARGEEVA